MKIRKTYLLLVLFILVIATMQGCGNNKAETEKAVETELDKESRENIKEETQERKEMEESEEEDMVLSDRDAEENLAFAVPGYRVGEIPPIPQPILPDLRITEAPEAKISVHAIDEISSVPGITVTPVKIENGSIVSGGISVQVDNTGGGQLVEDERTVQSDGSGGGQYIDDKVTIQTDGKGGGQYINNVTGVSLQVSGDGSGIYSDDMNEISLSVDSKGGGLYIDGKNDISISLSGDGSGTYSYGNIGIINGGDGSGSYTNDDLDLSIRNDGNGMAFITRGDETMNVEAEPIAPAKGLPKLAPIPPVPTIEANGILINLDSGVLFDVDKYNIRPDAEEILKKLAEILKKTEISAFQINGHTDSDDTDEHNQVLSENRANSVKDFLENQGVTATITTTGYGEKQPVATNDTPEGKQLNRRVEIIIPAN